MPDATLRAGEAGPCRAPVRFRLRVSAEQAADEFLLVKRGAPPPRPQPQPASIWVSDLSLKCIQSLFSYIR